MSYEGRQQLWCANGHYHVVDCRDDLDDWKCPDCGVMLARRNGVDDTNGEADGYINPVIKVKAKICECVECGNRHVAVPAVYEIPHKENAYPVGTHKR